MLIVVTVAVAPFLERPASAWRVVVLMLAGQGLLHVALEVAGSAAPRHGAPMTQTATGDGMAAMVPGVSSSSSTLWMLCLNGAHLNMLVTHVGAALVVALWLAAGERAAWTLLGVTGLAVAETWWAICDACVVTAVVVCKRPTALLARVDQRPAPRSVWDGGRALSQRGPPRVCAA
jgi:hypothetical protein